MRRAAREFALEAYRGALGLIDARIQWRRDNAALLALEAKGMLRLLRQATGKVAFRRARIRTWQARYRRHAARAWASQSLAVLEGCGVSLLGAP